VSLPRAAACRGIDSLGQELLGLLGRARLCLVLGPVACPHVIGRVFADEPREDDLEFVPVIGRTTRSSIPASIIIDEVICLCPISARRGARRLTDSRHGGIDVHERPSRPAVSAPLDDEARYLAVRSRDARFDGWFFVAVTSTGIYCRPSCPSPPARPARVRFFPTAAAAQRAGFRACKALRAGRDTRLARMGPQSRRRRARDAPYR